MIDITFNLGRNLVIVSENKTHIKLIHLSEVQEIYITAYDDTKVIFKRSDKPKDAIVVTCEDNKQAKWLIDAIKG